MKTNIIMTKRYFQHLNPHDDNFQTITTLEMVDDTDPDFVMYYFDDGSKCNKEFIGELNEQNVFGNKELVEVSSPSNKWVFAMKPETSVKQPEKIRTQSGEWVEVPSEDQWYGGNQFGFGNGKKKIAEKDKYVVKVKPKLVNPSTILVEEPKQEKTEAFNFNIKESSQNNKEQEIANVNSINTTTSIDVNKLGDTIQFTYNDKLYTMSKDQFFTNAITSPEEKVVIKEVIKEVKKEVCEDHIEIGLDETQKSLVDNMIDMSQKEHCDIDMSLTLNLPPMSVYKLIKSVYPKGMSEGFVNIIADRMKTQQLKKAVAMGLLSYYDEDSEIEIKEADKETIKEEIVEEQTIQQAEDNIPTTPAEDNSTVITKKKTGRPKKA